MKAIERHVLETLANAGPLDPFQRWSGFSRRHLAVRRAAFRLQARGWIAGDRFRMVHFRDVPISVARPAVA